MGMVTFVDETTAGERRAAWGLEVVEERLTVRELIRRRVFHEVAEYNARAATGDFRGLVQPVDTESPSDGGASRGPREVDAERQFEQAVVAFGRNGFLVIVGDRQLEELDAEVDVVFGARVSFLKLVPLVGG
ncbi:hypothetical protein ACFVYR_17955 [Streptomyces sp. NPDC058284]|uniref:hypothetical protein n=1 Tax=unclassified Streptomyces TaxID=2593676 RepID=UPI00365878BF